MWGVLAVAQSATGHDRHAVGCLLRDGARGAPWIFAVHVAAALGWIEGASDAFSSFLKLAGWYSDRMAAATDDHVGYFFTGTGLSIFSIAGSWVRCLLGRIVSWFGKGIRGSLRDAMLSIRWTQPCAGGSRVSIAREIWVPSSVRIRWSGFLLLLRRRRRIFRFFDLSSVADSRAVRACGFSR